MGITPLVLTVTLPLGTFIYSKHNTELWMISNAIYMDQR